VSDDNHSDQKQIIFWGFGLTISAVIGAVIMLMTGLEVEKARSKDVDSDMEHQLVKIDKIDVMENDIARHNKWLSALTKDIKALREDLRDHNMLIRLDERTKHLHMGDGGHGQSELALEIIRSKGKDQ